MNAEPSGAYTEKFLQKCSGICMFLLSSWVIVKEGNTLGRQTKLSIARLFLQFKTFETNLLYWRNS